VILSAYTLDDVFVDKRKSATCICPGRTRLCLEKEDSNGDLEVVYSPVSIRAEPSVAWVDANVSRKKTEAYAKAYLEFLHSDQPQETMARHGYQPINPGVLRRYTNRLPHLFPITIIARNWDEAQEKFFSDS